jgi:hypothetical protein
MFPAISVYTSEAMKKVLFFGGKSKSVKFIFRILVVIVKN